MNATPSPASLNEAIGFLSQARDIAKAALQSLQADNKRLTCENGAVLRVDRMDSERSAEGWTALVICEHEAGERPTDEAVMDALEESGLWHFAPAGCDGPGLQFAREPWVRFIGRTVLIEQTGGLDV